MSTALVTNIVWDCDDETAQSCGLPAAILVLNTDFEDPDTGERLTDFISNAFGFCHNGFDWAPFEGQASFAGGGFFPGDLGVCSFPESDNAGLPASKEISLVYDINWFAAKHKVQLPQTILVLDVDPNEKNARAVLLESLTRAFGQDIRGFDFVPYSRRPATHAGGGFFPFRLGACWAHRPARAARMYLAQVDLGAGMKLSLSDKGSLHLTNNQGGLYSAITVGEESIKASSFLQVLRIGLRQLVNPAPVRWTDVIELP